MPLNRRQFTTSLLRASSALLAAPALVRAQTPSPGPAILPGSRPRIDHGVASGDVTFDSAVVWSRTDRPARLQVEWATNDSFRDARLVEGPVTGPDADFTAKLPLEGLPAGTRIFYRVRFADRGGPRELGNPVVGEFRTAARDPRDVFFAWGGDTCGQGFGIDVARGGLLTYDSIQRLEPEFLVHSGDLIYADSPIAAELKLPDGTLWRSVVTEEKSKVAETLAEYRGNFRYNLLDAHVRACQARVPLFAQWDDHEVRDNWYPGRSLSDDPRYREKDINVLAARARQAFLEYTPIRDTPDRRIYRHVPRGPLCDLFFLDLRSYRGPNNPNRQKESSPETAYLGEPQLGWLRQALSSSRGRWKIICADMPIACLVPDAGGRWEACANGDDGVPLGRELEIARLLQHLKRERIRNVLWLTADVHYAAAHHFDPARAAFTDFEPFWEFVSGPLHAATYGPNALDGTFGPEARWRSRPAGARAGVEPSANEQFFGTVRIDARTGSATVTQYNRVGLELWNITLPPAA